MIMMVYEGAELLTNFKKSKPSQAVSNFNSKRHKSKDNSDANSLTQPVSCEDDGFEQMEFSENNDNTDLLTKIDGDTSQQQSNANRGSGGSNGGLRTRPPLLIIVMMNHNVVHVRYCRNVSLILISRIKILTVLNTLSFSTAPIKTLLLM